jgi:hypothetical protein
MSRYDHLKNRKPSRSVDEFIEGANKDSNAKKARKRVNKQNILLSVTGRISMDDYGKPDLIYIRRDIKSDIDKYCAGTKQSILNYLLRRALDDLIQIGEKVIAEME